MDKIICVGKNYLKHAQEMGGEINDEPIYFLKPASSMFLAEAKQPLQLPDQGEIHHELELVLQLSEEFGSFRFTHYTFGLDLTIRDLQNRLKKAGQPWEKSKVFKNSAVLGPWQKVDSLDAVLAMSFELKVNGDVRQKGVGDDMRWKPQELLVDIKKWFPVFDGDLLFTGTPEGVGPLKKGDVLEVSGGAVNYKLTCA